MSNPQAQKQSLHFIACAPAVGEVLGVFARPPDSQGDLGDLVGMPERLGDLGVVGVLAIALLALTCDLTGLSASW